MNSSPFILVNKPRGMTPLQLIHAVKRTYSEFSSHTVGYAGRLDPMAEGLMILLIDEENKRRKDYERLPKTYECTFVFGIETDTYDALGIVTDLFFCNISDASIQKILPRLTGKLRQEYPPYSAVRIRGKSLFQYAKTGTLSTITIPSKEIEIYSFAASPLFTISRKELLQEIQEIIPNVMGDFRQTEIISRWNEIGTKLPTQIFAIKVVISASRGTYMRSIAHELGKLLQTGAIAFHIKRTIIGPYTLGSALLI